jgi:hypothetical protein
VSHKNPKREAAQQLAEADPAAFEGSEEEKLEKFREVRDQIDERIKQWLAEVGR